MGRGAEGRRRGARRAVAAVGAVLAAALAVVGGGTAAAAAGSAGAGDGFCAAFGGVGSQCGGEAEALVEQHFQEALSDRKSRGWGLTEECSVKAKAFVCSQCHAGGSGTGAGFRSSQWSFCRGQCTGKSALDQSPASPTRARRVRGPRHAASPAPLRSIPRCPRRPVHLSPPPPPPPPTHTHTCIPDTLGADHHDQGVTPSACATTCQYRFRGKRTGCVARYCNERTEPHFHPAQME